MDDHFALTSANNRTMRPREAKPFTRIICGPMLDLVAARSNAVDKIECQMFRFDPIIHPVGESTKRSTFIRASTTSTGAVSYPKSSCRGARSVRTFRRKESSRIRSGLGIAFGLAQPSSSSHSRGCRATSWGSDLIVAIS